MRLFKSGLVIVLVLAAVLALSACGSGAAGVQQGGDIEITKSEVTEKAMFIPYKSDDTYMEVIALKAPDGTIRTAFNTCQVCYNSGRGYYLQEGDVLVCQNCGNRFSADQVEIISGGCNPVPILEDYKTNDGEKITIAEAFLSENSAWFYDWKR